MGDAVTVTHPYPGVALVTVADLSVPTHSLSCKTASELADVLVDVRQGGARVIVLASGIEGVWLNHAYLRDIAELFQGRPATGDPAGYFRSLNELSRTPVVSIAAISGETSGGGCELGWACDLRIAETQAVFSQPEVIIGVGTGIGGTCRLMRLIGHGMTAQMVLTGLPVTASALHARGAVNEVVPTGEAVARSLEIARHIASLPPAAVAAMKTMLWQDEDLTLSAGLENDQALSQTLFSDPDALQSMQQIQAQFDAGRSLSEVYWPDSADGPAAANGEALR